VAPLSARAAREVRALLGLTPEEIAGLVGVRLASVTRWERHGILQPPLLLVALVDAARRGYLTPLQPGTHWRLLAGILVDLVVAEAAGPAPPGGFRARLVALRGTAWRSSRAGAGDPEQPS